MVGYKMKIGEMFQKPIDRSIKGVIKVGKDNEENIYQELDEYVVTRELLTHFRDFFENYKQGINNHTDEMGVWISGFFGSGKSHFLKILSYILENKEVKNKKAIDFFREDQKIVDQMVLADMELAANTPTDVILFNIASKSSASHIKKDSIIDIFMKVFNENQGFCGEIPFLAEMERKLVEEEYFDEFQKTFKKINGCEWLDERDSFFLISDDVVKTIVKIGYMSEDGAQRWADKAEDNYTVNIEKFAQLVNEYCEKKGNDHHIVFLIDEMGQYIGDDSKLMLDLQTVTENLGIYCGGKAWIIVTSQQNIDDMIDVKGDDFSKIQGRFNTRLSLSSANVDEVIRKRILSKKEPSKQTLELLYAQKEPILKNLIHFSSDTAEMKKYANSKDFSEVYPFVPYQFNLLGNVLNSIRTHGAAGKHLSEGERSMLALFKDSAVSFMDENCGVLMPFNKFYDSLHQFIDHTHSIVITRANDNQNLEVFDVEVLKVLFMIKYVKEIKADLDNLTTLMISKIDEERLILRKKIDKSLQRLEGETLIQKNGEVYSFLTNEEQDISRAIKQENVEIGERINQASDLIFEEIYQNKKYQKSSRYNFPFNQAVDGRYRGNRQSANLGVHVITPYYEFRSSNGPQTQISPQSEKTKIDTILRGMSENKNEVIIYLDDNMSFLEEITGMLQIKRYLTKNGAELSLSSKDIYGAKQREVTEKSERAKMFLEDTLKHADIYVKGTKLDIKDKNPSDRINQALEKLVNETYYKLSDMKDPPEKSDILNVINHIKPDGFGNPSNVGNHRAIDDMVNYIDLETRNHAKVSLKSALDYFKRPPYGFTALDVQWLVSVLFAQKRIFLEKLSEPITLKKYSAQQILNLLTNRDFNDKILIDKKEITSTILIKDAKDVLKDFFGVANTPDDDESLMEIFQEKSQDKFVEIDLILKEYNLENRYPGKSFLEDSHELIQDVNKINSTKEFFNYVSNHKNDFLDCADDLEPVVHFFSSTQREFFKNACELVDLFDKSKNYMDDPDIIVIANKMHEIINMQSPYSNIHRLPELIERFKTLNQSLLEKHSRPVLEEIDADLHEVLSELISEELKSKFDEEFRNNFDEIKDKLVNCMEIAAIPGTQRESGILRDKCIEKIERFKAETPPQTEIPKITKEIVDLKKISSSRITIKKEEDLNKFLELIRNKIKDKIEDDKVIILRI